MRNIEADYQEAMAAQSDKANDLKFAVQIIAGLLATGHYTEPCEDGEVLFRKWDAGKDWKDDFTQRWHYHVVMDAVDLLQSLKAEVNARPL
jgi:hypothetical protein